MHTFNCSCGDVITIDPPTEQAGYIVWDSNVDASIDVRRKAIHGFLTAVSNGQRDAWMRYFYGGTANRSRFVAKTNADVIEDIFSKHDSYTHICYRCDSCGRIYVQVSPGLDEFEEYFPHRP